MKGMILAAGLGTRLGEITKDRPKALVELDGVTMLEVVAKRLIEAGVDSLVINLHYKGELIKELVRARNSFGIKVQFSEEPKILGTGGGIKKARSFLDGNEPFIVHNCDVYSSANLAALISKHRATKAVATLATLTGKESSFLLVGPDGSICGWEVGGKVRECYGDLKSVNRVVFSGIQILSPSIFEVMASQAEEFSIVETYLNACKVGMRVQSESIANQYWIDIGTPERLESLRMRFKASARIP
ncbi:MAG: NTP transferase domain-containing protein [Oligoflexia bacterium]|nr:NTP transferase domain-containing protein [Oligoflexia bacterium]